jgi:hypothetical protein
MSKPIEKFDYPHLHMRLTGTPLDLAAPEAMRELSKKLNEVIEVVNKLKEKSNV